MKRLFTGLEHGQIEGFKPSGVLADFVEVTDPAWEKACEEFLHEELEYVVVERLERSRARRGVDARRIRRPRDIPGASRSRARRRRSRRIFRSQPGVVGRLRDTLRLTNGFAQAPQGLLPRLARCFLVSDRAAAQRLADGASRLLLPAAGRRQLSRPRGQRRPQDRRRSAGAEARAARAERARWKRASAKPTS